MQEVLEASFQLPSFRPLQREIINAAMSTPRTLHPTPYTLHPTPYTLQPTPYTVHPTPDTLHPTPYTLHPTPYTYGGGGSYERGNPAGGGPFAGLCGA